MARFPFRAVTNGRGSLARTLFAAALVFATGSLTSCGRTGRFLHRRSVTVATTSPAMRARIARGREAYARYCALCHAPNGRGYAADHANAIGNADFLAVATDEFLRAAITDGRPGTPMSAWGQARGGPLAGPAVDSIVAYLRSLARRRPIRAGAQRVEGSADRARSLYAERCVACHGERGEGTPRATSLSHPNFQRTASNGFLRYTIEHGRAGTPMASFAFLGEQAVGDLVFFIRTLEHDPTPIAPPAPPSGPPPPGLEHLILNPTGRSPRFTLRDGRYVPSADVARALAEHRRIVILDARAASDWSLAHVTGALPFPFYDVEQLASRLPRDGTWIVAYCACPHAASGHVVDELRRRNFDHTAVLDEGIGFWMAHNYPTERAAPP